MTSKKAKKAEKSDDILPEYDFANMKDGVRGKYYQAYRQGHTVKIHKEDGTTIEQDFKFEDGAIVLDPDVKQYFPDSEAVNRALRCLIPLVSKQGMTNE